MPATCHVTVAPLLRRYALFAMLIEKLRYADRYYYYSAKMSALLCYARVCLMPLRDAAYAIVLCLRARDMPLCAPRYHALIIHAILRHCYTR